MMHRYVQPTKLGWMSRPRLITIGPSHYCEKARWALERANVDYVEEAHAPIIHMPFAFVRGRQRTTPIFVTQGATIGDSTAIVRHADQVLDEASRLFPSDPELERKVVELEDLFDEKLGPATRRLTYFHLLHDRALLTETVTRGLSAPERLAFRLATKPVVAMIRRGLRITESGAARSKERIDQIFSDVAARLQTTGAYLTGERFTAADLAFAALAAPVLLPPLYGWPLPASEGLPFAMRNLVESYRRTTAGAFAMRLYLERRQQRA